MYLPIDRPSDSESLGMFVSMHISVSKGTQSIFRDEAWAFAFSPSSSGDFHGLLYKTLGQSIPLEYLPNS